MIIVLIDEDTTDALRLELAAELTEYITELAIVVPWKISVSINTSGERWTPRQHLLQPLLLDSAIKQHKLTWNLW